MTGLFLGITIIQTPENKLQVAKVIQNLKCPSDHFSHSALNGPAGPELVIPFLPFFSQSFNRKPEAVLHPGDSFSKTADFVF